MIKHLYNLLIIVSLVCLTASAQEYVGSEACGNCHPDNFQSWEVGGHHYSLSPITSAAPEFPFEYQTGSPNVVTPPTISGNPLDWSDISYTVGGYYREAIFVDSDGYVITGSQQDQTAWSVWDRDWNPYHPGDQLSMDCGQCHTTGYNPDGHQGGLSGITGTWAEDGVGCEACHGPDS